MLHYFKQQHYKIDVSIPNYQEENIRLRWRLHLTWF